MFQSLSRSAQMQRRPLSKPRFRNLGGVSRDARYYKYISYMLYY